MDLPVILAIVGFIVWAVLTSVLLREVYLGWRHRRSVKRDWKKYNERAADIRREKLTRRQVSHGCNGGCDD